jgi:hypothetical protein
MSSFDFEAGLFIARLQLQKGVSAKASVERRAARGPEPEGRPGSGGGMRASCTYGTGGTPLDAMAL